MMLSRLVSALTLYVVADFANPLMPGAVTFIAGSIEAVHTERARVPQVVPDALPVVPPHPLEPITPMWRPPRPAVIRPAIVWLVLAPRHLCALPDPPPFSEDH